MDASLLKAGFILLASASVMLINTNARENIFRFSKRIFIRKRKDINYVEPDKINFT